MDIIVPYDIISPSLQAAASTATLTTGGLDNEPRSGVTETSGGASGGPTFLSTYTTPPKLCPHLHNRMYVF